MKTQIKNLIYVLASLFFLLCLVGCLTLSPGRQNADQESEINNNELRQRKELSTITNSLHKLAFQMDAQRNSIIKLNQEVNSLKVINRKALSKEKFLLVSEKPVLQHNSSSKLNKHENRDKIIQTFVYTKPGRLYKKARSLLLEGSFKKAEALFIQFIKKYPYNDLADNAFYWLGECHYTMGDYKGAVKIFKALVKKYPKGGKVPAALLKTAYAYLSLNDVNRANYYLKLVVSKYPFTEAGEKAELKLKTFQ